MGFVWFGLVGVHFFGVLVCVRCCLFVSLFTQSTNDGKLDGVANTFNKPESNKSVFQAHMKASRLLVKQPVSKQP